VELTLLVVELQSRVGWGCLNGPLSLEDVRRTIALSLYPVRRTSPVARLGTAVLFASCLQASVPFKSPLKPGLHESPVWKV